MVNIVRLLDHLWIKITCKFIEQDSNGNKYYESYFSDYLGTKFRHVIKTTNLEPSSMNSDWYMWLHYLSDTIPKDKKKFRWQKDRKPNQTGTKNSYIADRKTVSAEYIKWQPNK